MTEIYKSINHINPEYMWVYFVRIFCWELSVASCQLRVVSCELSVASCQLRVSSCELSVASCQLRVVSCELSVACSFFLPQSITVIPHCAQRISIGN